MAWHIRTDPSAHECQPPYGAHPVPGPGSVWECDDCHLCWVYTEGDAAMEWRTYVPEDDEVERGEDVDTQARDVHRRIFGEG